MKTVFALAVAILVSACASGSQQATAPAYTIHNPGIYASDPPLVDDDGHPLPVVSKRPVGGTGSASR